MWCVNNQKNSKITRLARKNVYILVNIENFYQYYNGYCLTKSEYKNLRPVSVSLIYKDMTRDIIDILEMKESTKDKLTFYTNSLNLITEEYNLVYTSNKEENGTFTYKKE